MPPAKKTSASKPSSDGPDESLDETPKGLVVTVREQDYTIQPEALDDFELLDNLNELDGTGNPAYLPTILRRLLGPQQTKAVFELLRDPVTRRVSIEAGTEFVTELLDTLNPN